MSQNEPTIASILQSLATRYDSPVAEREVMDRVLEQRPSRAKDPYAAIREKLRWQGPVLGWVRLGGGILVPLRVVLRGLRFRCLPDERDIRSGLLDLSGFAPFVRLPKDIGAIEDADGSELPLTVVSLAATSSAFRMDMLHPRLDLAHWYAASGFTDGDSILVTVLDSAPLRLRLQHEPQASIKAEAVAAQDAELLAAIWEHVRRAQTTPLHSAEVVLAAFARAAWRTTYPGLPWQLLVQRDGRMRVVDGVYLALSTERQPSDLLLSDYERGLRWAELDQRLLHEIDSLQEQLHTSRQRDAEAGFWRSSASPAPAWSGGPMHDSFEHTRYDDDDPTLDEEKQIDELLDPQWDDEDFDDETALGIAALIGRDPGLLGASQRLLAALPPDEAERLRHARPEEAELIIAARLNELLAKEPTLFITVAGKGAIGPYGSAIYLDSAEPDLEQSLEDNWDEEDWGTLIEDDDLGGEGLFSQSDMLMRQFHDFLRESGKSESTARSRAGDLWVYAEFLARYYGRTLEQGDYTTLDECLFFFYPREVASASPRYIRNLCTSIKQFYAFLKERGLIADDGFAQALWRRREEAARVVELFNRLSSESPNFDMLFQRLFAPYTS